MRKKEKLIFKRSSKPRYLIIKIKYWPIPRLVWIIPVLFIAAGVLLQLQHVLVAELRSMNQESREKIAYERPLSSFWQARPESFNSSRFDVRDPGYPKGTSLFEVAQARMTNGVTYPTIIFHGSRNQKQVALTFDADMTYGMQEMLSSGEVASFYDQELIQYLTEAHVKATLFLTGLWIESYYDVAKELANNPRFELANHSYSHPSFSGDCYGLGEIPDDQNQEQIEKTQRLLQHVTGKKNDLFRFPGGCYSQADLESAKQAGVTVVQWDVVADDGFNDDAEAIYHNVVDRVGNGSIIVMHMNGIPNEPQTASVVPRIVERLKQEGYTFVTIGEILEKKQAISLSRYLPPRE